MTDPTHIDQLLRLFDLDHNDDLMWRTTDPAGHSDRGQLAFSVQCSDTYWWATADCERIDLPADLVSLRQARDDAKNHLFWATLWVSRKRRLRPMRAWLDENGDYEDNGITLRPLLEAAGPERDRKSEG